MKVVFPDRILNRHVGGNTTYARRIRDGLEANGIATGTMPSSGNPVATALGETRYGLSSRPDELLHYSADTGPLVSTKARSVVTVHGVASRWISVARNKRQESIWRFRVGRAIASTDRLITVSESAADDIADVFGVARDTIAIVPHGIDYEQFAVPTTMSEALRARLPNEFVLYLGNVEPRKNLIELVGAFQRSELASLGIPLVIAGRPAWNFEEAIETINAAPNVVYLGFVSDSDRIALMQACSLFAFPSLYEGFGFPVLEAMAAGAPVAASRRGSLAEVSGPAFELSDLSADGLSHDLARALGDSARLATVRRDGSDWARRFKWDDSIDRHIQIYREVMAA